ncbi:MAG TPA: zinc-binding dehydrogenase [Gaiellaceae bacterium]|jgi:NADPH:quinone reductase-like Zn-dependent oxidoreductase
MRAVVFTGAGGREVMRLEDRADPVPGADEVLVAASFAGLNAADLAQRAGSYPAPPGAPQDVPGLEVAGVVVAAGASVRSVAEGDRVFGLVGGGGLADRVVVHERHVTAVPDAISDEDAAAAPEAFITAHDALVTRGGLGLGDVLLVNGANGGVGSAGVQIGVAAGARVLASSRGHHDRLSALGAEPVAPDDAVERARAAGGADVVLELVGAPNLPRDLEALATRGRIVVVGTGAGVDAAVSLRALMGKRAAIHGTVLRARPLEEKALAVQRFAHEVVPHLAAGRMRAIVDRVFAADDAADAFDYFAESGKFGKVILAF